MYSTVLFIIWQTRSKKTEGNNIPKNK